MKPERDPWRIISTLGWILAFLTVTFLSAYIALSSAVEYVQSRGVLPGE